MDINDIKNGNFSQKDVKEACKEIDNESIYDFVNSLKEIVNERERKNKGYFIGYADTCEGDNCERYYMRLGFITEAEAGKCLEKLCDYVHEDIMGTGYRQVDEKAYSKYNICKLIDDLDYFIAYNYDIPEYIKHDIEEYQQQLHTELDMQGYEWGTFLDDYKE